MINLILLFNILSLIYCDDTTSIEHHKEIVRNSKISLNLNNLINDPTLGFGYLNDNQIEGIKKKAKNFIPIPISENDIIIMETSHGIIKFELYNKLAPNHCLNFKKLANSGFYDGTIFHRSIKNFILQGGDILSRDIDPENDGLGNPGWIINAEINDLRHSKGTLSMHRVKGDINSAGSQFFICLSDQPKLDNNYTIFGKVIKNINVIDIIQNVPSQSRFVMKLLKKGIPNNVDKNDWVEIYYNDKIYFAEIPFGKTKKMYKEFLLDQLKNKNSPSVPIRIKKIRVQENGDQ